MQDDREVGQALKIVEQSAYSREEMRGMDKYWDIIRVQRAVSNRYGEGYGDGKADGLIEGKAQGLAEGKAQGALQMLIGLVREGMLTLEVAARKAGISESEFKAALDK